MSDDRNGASGVILSFLLGGLTGAALAILFAPRSGRETREIIGDKLREGADRSREARDRAISRSRELREQAVSRGREVLDEASGYIEKQKEGIEKRRDRVAAAIEAGRQAYKEEKGKM